MREKFCRCGFSLTGDTLDLVNHVASQEHSDRLALMGIVEHNHSYRWVNLRGAPVDEFHPEAREYLTVNCAACCREAQREWIHDSELPSELCRFIDCDEHRKVAQSA